MCPRRWRPAHTGPTSMWSSKSQIRFSRREGDFGFRHVMVSGNALRMTGPRTSNSAWATWDRSTWARIGLGNSTERAASPNYAAARWRTWMPPSPPGGCPIAAPFFEPRFRASFAAKDRDRMPFQHAGIRTDLRLAPCEDHLAREWHPRGLGAEVACQAQPAAVNGDPALLFVEVHAQMI